MSPPAARRSIRRWTIAQREAATEGANAPVRSVEVTTFIAKAMPIKVPLRGLTKAKANAHRDGRDLGHYRQRQCGQGPDGQDR